MPTLQRSTSIAICLCAAVLAGCAKKDEAAVDTSSMMASSTTTNTMPAAPAPVNLADVAGKWNEVAKPESGKDTTATTFVLTATADTTGWTITFPGKAPIATQVQLSGDSVIVSAGPYDSVRRKGTKVTTESSFRLQDGKLVGTTTAHYKTTKADSVLKLKNEGTRAM